MIKKIASCFLSGEKSSTSITQSAILIASMGLASRILGLFRDRILASRFGAGDLLDAYYAAFKIPDLVYSLMIMGALSAAFVPVFTSLISNKKESDAWKLVNTAISIGLVGISLVVLCLWVIAPSLVSWMTFGYGDVKKDMVINLTRIMLISPLIMGISGIVGGVLNSFKKFFFYSLAPIFYNLGIVAGATFWASDTHPEGLAYGVILGAFLHLLIQIPEFFRCGFILVPSLNYRDKNFRKVVTLMIPRTMGLAVSQINLVVVTVIASTLEPGSLAIFNFANNLQSVPFGIFGISFAVAAFPTLSCLWSQSEKVEFREKIANTLRKILFFIIPFSALIYTLRAQIVRVVLGAGEFDWDATIMTLNALGIFSLSLWAQSSIPLLARSFYAMHNTKIPFFVGIFSEAVNLILAVWLVREHSILGLVWAFSISTSLNAVLLLTLLRVKVGSFKVKKMLWMLTKVVVATIFLTLATQSIKNSIGADPFGQAKTFAGVLTQLVSASAGGILVFILVGKFINIHELNHFIDVMKNKIFGTNRNVVADREEIAGQ